MTTPRHLVLALCAATSLFATGAFSAPDASGRWVKAESAHFIVYSDNPKDVTSAYLLRLERYRYVLTALYGVNPEDDAFPKLRVYSLKEFTDMKEVWPEASIFVAG